jgi:hypothetical protein
MCDRADASLSAAGSTTGLSAACAMPATVTSTAARIRARTAAGRDQRNKLSSIERLPVTADASMPDAGATAQSLPGRRTGY